MTSAPIAAEITRLRAEVCALHAELTRYDLVVWTATGPGINYIADSPSSLIASVTGTLTGS